MLGYVARRVAVAVPLLLIISIMVFALIHAVPGGPVEMFLANPNVRPEDVERLRTALGLDRPLYVQYLAWLHGFVTGQWGYSFADGRPVTARIWERVPATLELIGSAMALALAIAIPAGVMTARRHGSWLDTFTSTVSFAGIALPLFWFALILQLVFAVQLGWLPSSGRTSALDGSWLDRLRHLLLPAAVLAALHAAAWSRFLRSSMVDALRQRFVLAARARGLAPRSVTWRHAFRAALLPFVSVALLDAAIMVSGAVITESVFTWPGLGALFTESLARRDYAVVMAFLMLTSTVVIGLNLVADLAYRWLDPRVAVR